DIVALTAVVRGSGPHDVLSPLDAEVTGVVDDGSELARIVISVLGTRARYNRESIAIPPPPTAPTKPAAPPHPVQIVVDTIYNRLVELGVPMPGVTIAGVEQPLVRFDRTLRFAGDNPRLAAIANALRT